jgi:hypothetical protein
MRQPWRIQCGTRRRAGSGLLSFRPHTVRLSISDDGMGFTVNHDFQDMEPARAAQHVGTRRALVRP